MTVVHVPVECPTGFAASTRTKIAHRASYVEAVTYPGGSHLHGKWLCGSESRNTFLVDDPALLGGICEHCEIAFLTEPVVYRCWSVTEQLLYIGSCAVWSSREALHKAETPWWPEVARVDKVPQPNLGTAKRVERVAIRAEAPLYNRVHNVKRFRRDGNSFAVVTEKAA